MPSEELVEALATISALHKWLLGSGEGEKENMLIEV